MNDKKRALPEQVRRILEPLVRTPPMKKPEPRKKSG